MEKIRLISYLTLIIWLGSTKVNGQGHYTGGSFNPNDYFIPPASGWVFSMYYSNSQMSYFNNSGDKTDIIEISKEPPLNITIGQKVRTQSIIPMISYFGKKKLAKANWGVLVLPLFNNPNASIALDFYTGQTNAGGTTLNIKSFGIGDLYLQPLWLTWGEKKFSTTFSYGLWIPIGKYEANDPENVGLGYLSQNFRLASRFKPISQISLTAGVTYELNNQQKGTDFKEAPHLTFDYGASYNFQTGHELGVFGFGGWQVGNDSGEKAVPNKDKIYGLGIYGSYWFIPGKFGTLARFSSNFGTKNRFGGPAFQIGLNYLLFKY